MKRIIYIWLLVPIASVVFPGNAMATLVKSDFNALPCLDGLAAIETYMENIYGSDFGVMMVFLFV
jgi:hypothetical protein